MTVKPRLDVAAIERAYMKDRVTVDRICARFAITKYRFYRLADDCGWPRRVPRAPSPKEMAAAQLALVRRLYRRFERHLEEADARHQALGLMEADEVSERDARTLSSLARTLEKMIELDAQAAHPGAESAAGQGPGEPPMDEEDAERIRADLARRIAELARSGAGPGDAGGSGAA